MIEAGREYSAEIRDIALPSGHGVTRLGDLVVFVPGAVPGDRVRLRIVRLNKRFAYGELVMIEEESRLRERPRCPHVGRCGGCDLQALSYEAQLKIKENHLVQVLRRVGGQDLEGVAVASIVPSVDTFFYRGKVEFSFGEADGRVALGLSERPSPLRPSKGRVVPVEGCFLFSPAVAQVLPVVHEWLRKTGLTAYNPLTGKGTLKRLVLREAKGTGEIMCHLIAASHISRLPGTWVSCCPGPWRSSGAFMRRAPPPGSCGANPLSMRSLQDSLLKYTPFHSSSRTRRRPGSSMNVLSPLPGSRAGSASSAFTAAPGLSSFFCPATRKR